MKRERSCYILMVILMLVSPAAGQSISGRLTGIVLDDAGDVVQGALVTAVNKATNGVRTVVTNAEGQFVLTALEPGKYLVTISARGFKTVQIEAVEIRVATDQPLEVVLPPGGIAETIVVTDAPPLIDSKASDLGDVIAGSVMRQLPLNGRDFAQLTRLTAGATVDSEGGSAAVVVNGQRASATNFLVDGTEVNDPLLQVNGSGASGTSAAYASVESIQEFKVQSTNFSAEFGRYAGAVVNVVTRSGSNELHGSLFEFLRHDALDANNFFNNAAGLEKPGLRSNQFGGVIGGPIVTNRVFFFGTYEGLRQGFNAISNGTVPSLLAREMADERIRPILDQIVLPTGQPSAENPLLASFTGVTPSRAREDNISFRVDTRLGDSDIFFARYAGSDGRRRFGGSSVAAAPNVVDDGPSRLQNVALGYTHILGANLINEFRFGFNRIHLEERSIALPIHGAVPGETLDGSPTFPLLIVSDETLNNNIVGGIVGPSGDSFNTFQCLNNLSYIHGRHSIKLGADLRRVHVNRFDEGANGGESGVLVFATTDDLLFNFPQAFVNQVGIRRRGFRFTNIGFFAQEDFHTTRGLTWNLGLRYDINTVLREVNGLQSNVVFAEDGHLALTPLGDPLYHGDHNNLAPRIGFAYAPPGSHRLALRGGFGVYYDQVTQMGTNLLSNPPVTLTNTAFLPGPYPDFLPFLPSRPVSEPPYGSSTMIPVDIRTPYSLQYNISLQYEIGRNLKAQMAYVGNRGVKLLRERVINFLLPFGPIPGPVTSFRDPNFGLIEINETSALSGYNGLQLSLERRFSQGLSLLVSYTWSHSIDDASTLGLFGTEILGTRSASPFPSNPNDLRAERGNSNYDARHVLTVSYVWDLPVNRLIKGPAPLVDGWSLNGILTARSGQPFTVTVGMDAAGIGDATPFFSQRPNRVPGVPAISGGMQGPRLPLNPDAFSTPALGTFGNLGRNTFRGPSFSQYDFAITKALPLGERLSLQLRIEAFNLLNRTNFSLPTESTNLSLASQSPGDFGSSTSTVNSQNLNVGPVFAPGGPRSLQFGIKLVY